MNIKLIASDLDGTLLNHKKEIPEFTRRVLLQAMKKGIYFVPSTGRSFHSLPEEVLNLPGVEYIMTSNGAAIYSVSKQKRIYQCLMDSSSVEAILNLSLPENMILEAYMEGTPYAEQRYLDNPRAFGATEYGEIYVRNTRQGMADMREFISRNRNNLDSMSFVCPDAEQILLLKKKLEDQVQDLYITLTFAHMLEVGNPNAGKGQTLSHLLELLHISRDEAMAFGDAHNDLDMLASVTYGIAVENASEDCKKAAFAVTESNEEDGVGKAILRYVEALKVDIGV